MRICGIPCTVKSLKLRHVIHDVLRQIRVRAPEDFERIRLRVRKFAPYTRESENGWVTLGIAHVGSNSHGDAVLGPMMPIVGRTRRLSGRSYDFIASVIVELEESDRHAIATVAHELGHACTREMDFHERMLDYDDGFLIEELCADFYAYKWGFGRHIARDRGVFGPAPDSTFTAGPMGNIHRYRVTRGFRIRDLGCIPQEEVRR